MIKILLADDEPNILLLTEMLFKNMGMTVITAVNGQEVIDKAKADKPDIIVTDIVMPEKSGFDVCKELRASPDFDNIPIILLSALGDDLNKITGFDEGADDYITKPFNLEELKARVNAALFRYKARDRFHSAKSDSDTDIEELMEPSSILKIKSGIQELDEALYGGFPKGSNILITGSLGSGKSTLCRTFLMEGLNSGEVGLFLGLDDDPQKIKTTIDIHYGIHPSQYEKDDKLRFVDAYSWAALAPEYKEKYVVKGSLELNQLAGLVADAGFDIGQSIQSKKGGRRIIDSITSLFVQFNLSEVQQFVNKISRTASSFGDVTTLYTIEKETLTDSQFQHMTYIMDGVIECTNFNSDHSIKIHSMKWMRYKNKEIVVKKTKL